MDARDDVFLAFAHIGAPQPMRPAGPRRVQARVDWPEGARRLSVEVTDGGVNTRRNTLNTDVDAIEPALAPPRPGSDAFRLPAWPVKGVRGDQLGPNRAGRAW